MRKSIDFTQIFCEDAPDYHIIVAGSLLGVAVNRTKFSFPVGKVDMKTLYPMDMEEFMLALGEKDLTEQIKSVSTQIHHCRQLCMMPQCSSTASIS